MESALFFEEGLNLIIKGRYNEGIDRLLDGRDENNHEALLLLAYLHEHGIAVDKNYARAIDYYIDAFYFNFDLHRIEIDTEEHPSMSELKRRYVIAKGLLQELSDKLFLKLKGNFNLEIKSFNRRDFDYVDHIKKTYRAVETFYQEFVAIRDSLSADERGEWGNRLSNYIRVPFEAIQCRIMGEYILRSPMRSTPLMAPDKDFVDLLNGCMALLGWDADRHEKATKGMIGIADQSGDELWRYRAVQMYEYGECGRDYLEAAWHYSLAGKKYKDGFNSLKNKEEYQLLSDRDGGSAERCLELAKQHQDTSPILATQLALKAIARGGEVSPHLTKLIHCDGLSALDCAPPIEPRYSRLERQREKNDMAVRRYLYEALGKLQAEEESLKAKKAKEEAELRVKKAKEEAELRAKEEAERKANAPKVTISLYNIDDSNNYLNIKYRFEGKNLFCKPTRQYDTNAEEKNRWKIESSIVECWSKDGKRKYDCSNNARTTIFYEIKNSAPVDTIIGDFIYPSSLPIVTGELVLVLETIVVNPILSNNGVNVLRRHSILIRMEPHIIRDCRIQVLDWDNRNRRDYMSHNNR